MYDGPSDIEVWKRRYEDAAIEVERLRRLLDEVRGIVGDCQEVQAKFVPAVIWDLADWSKRAAP